MSLRTVAYRCGAKLPGRIGSVLAFASDQADLQAGRVPARLPRTVERLLRAADRALATKDVERAVDLAAKAQILAFHRRYVEQALPARTPDVDRDHLAPFRRSEVGRLLFDAETAAPLAVSDVSPRDRADAGGGTEPVPLRVLVVTMKNWTFIDRVIEASTDRGDVEWERIDLSELGLQSSLRETPLTRARLRATLTGERLQPPLELARALERCDVVFVEWGHHVLAYMSLLGGIGAEFGGIPLVTRIHRQELDTSYFHLVDVPRVDRWFAIAPHIAERARELAPRLEENRIRLVHNVNDLERFDPDKTELAGRTLLHMGWSRPLKDPEFAFDVLEKLRRHDPDWRLLLAGPGPDPASRNPWSRRVRERRRTLGDAVVELGHREDMEAVLRDTGFLVSTSLSEGSHESVAEGAAAACVPVVRDWPAVRAYGGAASVYPAPWVVRDVEQAVSRILAHADPAARTLAGALAREQIFLERDPDKILEEYVSALREVSR